jgi:mercuric ion transport protein
MNKSDKYSIEGMTCSGCERTVQKMIGSLKGVEEAKASVESKSVQVKYDPAQVNEDEFRKAVEKVGYKLTAKI